MEIPLIIQLVLFPCLLFIVGFTFLCFTCLSQFLSLHNSFFLSHFLLSFLFFHSQCLLFIALIKFKKYVFYLPTFLSINIILRSRHSTFIQISRKGWFESIKEWIFFLAVFLENIDQMIMLRSSIMCYHLVNSRNVRKPRTLLIMYCLVPMYNPLFLCELNFIRIGMRATCKSFIKVPCSS